MTDHTTSQDAATDWLLAVYDDIDNPFPTVYVGGAQHRPMWWRGVYVQPMFTLKSALDAGKQMRVSARDYADRNRRFL